MADLTSMWPSWGSQGSQPSDGKQHSAGDNPKADAYNHLWYQIRETFDSVETWVSANETDISNLQSNKLDGSNYTPVSDVDSGVTAAASTVSGLDSQVDTNVTDISSLDSNKADDPHGNAAHNKTFAINGDSQPPEPHASDHHSEGNDELVISDAGADDTKAEGTIIEHDGSGGWRYTKVSEKALTVPDGFAPSFGG